MAPLELALVLVSALLHASWSLWIKGSRDPLTFNLLQGWLGVVLLAGLSPFIDFAELPTALGWLLAASGVAHGLYMYWMSRAYEHGDLSLVYPIARSTPAFLPLVAVPLLGDSLSPVGVVGIAVVVCGIWLIHGSGRWTLQHLTSPAARFAFLTLAATVIYSLLDKAAMAAFAPAPWSSPVPRALVYSLVLGIAYQLVFGPIVLRAKGLASLRTSAHREIGRASLAALVSLASYTLILRALETAPVSYVVAVRQSGVLFAVALGVLFLGDRPGRERVGGAILTVLGVALIAFS